MKRITLRESELVNLIKRVINEGKTRCNGKHVGGGDYNDKPCGGGQECHRKFPFTNIHGCFTCREGERCGYDDMNVRPREDSTYMNLNEEAKCSSRNNKGGQLCGENSWSCGTGIETMTCGRYRDGKGNSSMECMGVSQCKELTFNKTLKNSGYGDKAIDSMRLS